MQIGNRLNPHCVEVVSEEFNSPRRVVVQKENAAANGQIRLGLGDVDLRGVREESLSVNRVNRSAEGDVGGIIQDWINGVNNFRQRLWHSRPSFPALADDFGNGFRMGPRGVFDWELKSAA